VDFFAFAEMDILLLVRFTNMPSHICCIIETVSCWTYLTELNLSEPDVLGVLLGLMKYLPVCRVPSQIKDFVIVIMEHNLLLCVTVELVVSST